jgi:DMSO/TMAO reductase YedYZ molybdopterin-dependent catalytic subunit
VAFDSADGYFENRDRRSAEHPQTLLVSWMNGAPLRLASPLKLGYMQSKWVTRIRLLAAVDPLRPGTWEDQGYEWYAGL